MGCSQSKIENEEAVARCKDRKHFMKQSVSVRNALAAAHSAYATYLKNTGAALTDFAEGEVQNPDFTSPAAVAAAAQQAFEIPLPPPPLPDFPNPLYRSATMPEIKMMNSVGTIAEVEDEEDQVIEEEEEEEARPPPPSKQRAGYPMQMQQMQMQQEQNAALEYFFPSAENMPGATLKDVEEIDLNNEEVEIQRKVSEEKPRRGIDIDVDDDGVHMVMRSERDNEVSEPGERTAKQNVNLFQIFTDLDDHFLKASESAHEVSKMLEATRLHYHSNFADNRGHINHSARVMRVITWNRSFRGIPSMDDVKDDFDSEEHETHATVLDKLLAWEKKLYDEVKAGELMKFEYQRKVATLNKLKKRGTNFEALEKAKATVSLLHTRYIVDMQSLDSTVSEINRLRDQELYPRLVELVDGMATMWRVMQAHHEKQSSIVTLLRSLDISQSPTETSEHHHDRTYQLLIVVQEWQSQFEKLVNNQRRYIKALSSWLKLNLIPIESNMKEKVSSPPRVKSPPIQILLHAWHDHLEKLPDELARTAIANFAAVIDSIFHQQEEELHLKRKCEETRKELTRKKKQFDDWESKYKQKKIPDEFDLDGTEGENDSDEVVREKRLLYEQVKRRLDEEEETYAMQCQQVRQKSLGSLKNRMPELFRAMSDFSLECSKMYRELKSKSQKLSSGQS
ncbi:nitrate regulatory gene2 protein isoform X2 [Gastrolobium bilobum]|uniref:nitrate regulatory gene2 protein isoform X2 n=1 Tax=Gastrolobium bilobum TaxID=150636 RepID=UPI002AB25A2A|nr:nitrate regulatory gene2 protein isoform X2 [Gastrolobium bilobum]